MNTTSRVNIPNVRYLGTGKKRRYQVRWTVAGTRERTMAFDTRRAAETYRGRLLAAAAAGELWDTETREPVSWRAVDAGPTIAEYVRDYVAANWATWLPMARRSFPEGAAAWLPGFSTRPLDIDRGVLYDSVRKVLNPEHEATREQADHWRRLVAASRKVGTIRRVHIDEPMRLCNTKQDGTPAAPNYVARRRSTLGQVMKDLVGKELLETSPMAGVRATPKARQASKKVDTAEIGEPEQVLRVLAVVATVSGNYHLLFAVMFYAGLRPSEAVVLRWRDFTGLPATGWGSLVVRRSAAEAGKAFTDTGDSRQETGLKWRQDGEVRRVPIPPELVALVLAQRPEKVDGDALVFPGRNLARNAERQPVSSSTMQQQWAKARAEAFAGRDVPTALLYRPYSLRHSAASLWLGLGIGPSVVAARLGHSEEQLLATYADALPSHQEEANEKIAAAYEAAAERLAAEDADAEEVRAQRIAELEAQLAALRGDPAA